MDASTLIGATSGISTDEDLEEHLKTLSEKTAIIFRIMMKHLGDEIEFSALHPHLGIRGRIHGEGLDLLAKNIVKYMK
jgi:hypothetical protein